MNDIDQVTLHARTATVPSEPARKLVTLIVLAKLPIPGMVKTRLSPPCTDVEAASIAEAALRDTLLTTSRVVDESPQVFSELVIVLERAGRPTPAWITDAGRVIDQSGAGLAERLAHAFAQFVGPAFLIAMDTPQVTASALRGAAQSLGSNDSVFGPASDGGFWLIGFAENHASVFDGVPMSTAETGEKQLLAMRAVGLSPKILETMTDFDTYRDAVDISQQIPTSNFHVAVSLVARRLNYGKPMRETTTLGHTKHLTH